MDEGARARGRLEGSRPQWKLPFQKTTIHLASYHRRWQTQAPGRGGGEGGRVWRVLISTLDLHSARFKIEEAHGGELAGTATARAVGQAAAEVSMLTLPDCQ